MTKLNTKPYKGEGADKGLPAYDFNGQQILVSVADEMSVHELSLEKQEHIDVNDDNIRHDIASLYDALIKRRQELDITPTVPTREDYDKLSAEVARLSSEVEKLKGKK